jgi:uncharacterized membrane protein YagU involved in acid resistance
MSTRTETVTAERTDNSWVGGVLAGLAGAVAMTALMLAMGATNVLAGAIPGLYGLALPPNPPAGLVVHLSHGAVLGVAFAALVGAAGFDDARSVVGAGVAYGVVTWVALAALVMPLWLDAVGFAMAPPFPNFAPPSLLWHLVYGVVTGAVYTGVRGL